MVKRNSGKKKERKINREKKISKRKNVSIDTLKSEKTEKKIIKTTNFNSNLIPLRILEIKSDGTKSGRFIFTIQFQSLFNYKNKNIVLNDISLFEKKFKIWILSKFLKNVKELSVVEKIKKWCFIQIEILEDFCKFEKIDINDNFINTIIPPKLIYKNISFNCFSDDFRLPPFLPKKEKTNISKSVEETINYCKSMKKTTKVEQAKYLSSLLIKVNKLKELQKKNNKKITKDEIKDQIEEIKIYLKNFN